MMLVAGGAVLTVLGLLARESDRSARHYEKRRIAMRWDQIAAQRRREGRGARAVRVLQRTYAKTRFGLLVTGVCCIGVGIVTLLPG